MEQKVSISPKPKLSGIRNWIKRESEEFLPESGRYHLYVAYQCPYAQRAHIALTLKGLQNHIGLSVVHPTFQRTKPDVDDHTGWVFKNEDDPPLSNVLGYGQFSCKGCIPDTVNGCKTVRELYDLSAYDVDKYSVPLLWDKKLKVIVNNESAELIRMFNSEFNDISNHPELDLYPENLRVQIDEMNEWIVQNLNTPIHKCGFTTSQEEYNQACAHVFESLDKLEETLSKNRYLIGKQFTEADIKLFVILLRFDEVTYILYKVSKKRIADYSNLQDYCREIYQMPGVAETVNMEHTKNSSYSRYPNLNPYAIVPVGPDVISDLKNKHSRNKFDN